MFTTKDIQVFVMTRNRPEMLKQSLISLQKQTAQGFDFYVFDNSDNDDTQRMMADFPSINYIRTSLSVPNANFLKMQELIKKPYILTLHDDDLLHPAYLETALKVINANEGLVVVSSRYQTFDDNDLPQAYRRPQALSKKYYLIKSQAEFALSFWDKPSPIWSGSIIRGEVYKQTDIAALRQKFGKIMDWSLLIECAAKGKSAILFDRNYIFYRRHSGQDTNDEKTAVTIQQILNWLQYFCDFAQGNKKLEDIYFLNAVNNGKSNYFNFSCSKFRQECDLKSFFNLLKIHKLANNAMILYSRRKQSLFYKIITLPQKLLRRRDYFAKYLKSL